MKFERKNMITPWLKSIARITLWSIIKSVVSTGIGLGVTGVLVWRLFLVKRWVEDVEYEGNIDADHALEEIEEKDDNNKKEEKSEENGKESEKGRKK